MRHRDTDIKTRPEELHLLLLQVEGQGVEPEAGTTAPLEAAEVRIKWRLTSGLKKLHDQRKRSRTCCSLNWRAPCYTASG